MGQIQLRPAHRLFERGDLADVGAAEAVDGLLAVANHEQLADLGGDVAPVSGNAAVLGGEKHCDLRLNRVGILHFVYEQPRKARAEVVSRVRIVPQHVARPH